MFKKIYQTIFKSQREPFELTMERVVLTYLIGGVAGTLWETVLTLITRHHFEMRAGSFFTPFNPVYGFGLLLIVVCLNKVKKKYQLFLYGSILGGGAEYLMSFLQEKLLNSKSWDYSKKFLNINGRTTIPFCIFWGLAAFAIICYVVPLIFMIINQIPKKASRIIAIVGIVVIVLDLATTAFGLFRYNQRALGNEPFTFIGRIIDEILTDEVVKFYFPNMVRIEN